MVNVWTTQKKLANNAQFLMAKEKKLAKNDP